MHLLFWHSNCSITVVVSTSSLKESSTLIIEEEEATTKVWGKSIRQSVSWGEYGPMNRHRVTDETYHEGPFGSSSDLERRGPPSDTHTCCKMKLCESAECLLTLRFRRLWVAR